MKAFTYTPDSGKEKEGYGFFRTGYESIPFRAGVDDTATALISSVISLDGELLIVGNCSNCDAWRKACAEMDINVSVIDGSLSTLEMQEALDAIFANNRHISHVICSSDNSQLEMISMMTRKAKRSLIVEDSEFTIQREDIIRLNIDFLVRPIADAESLILARRSRLVQAEGNARKPQHDIYSIWQSVMFSRTSKMEPMAS